MERDVSLTSAPSSRDPALRGHGSSLLCGPSVALAACALALAGCDIGDQPADVSIGPELHAVATFPANGAGTECGPGAPDECGVPFDTPVEIRFDRFLLPKSATRQALRVYSSGPDQALFLAPAYDVVERVVTFRPAYGASFTPGLLYRVELIEPRKDKNGYGFRAFDGAPIVQSGSVPLNFSFRVSRVRSSPPAPQDGAEGAEGAEDAERAPTCREALDAFARSGCTGCHVQGGDAPMGLELDSGHALRQTAVSRVSHEVEGPDSGEVLVDPPHFGLGLARIQPGSPSRSYLFYKLLVNPENYGPGEGACETSHLVALPAGACLRPTDAERARIADWFVRMDPMPLGGALPGGIEDLRFFSDFIRAGADTTNCD